MNHWQRQLTRLLVAPLPFIEPALKRVPNITVAFDSSLTDLVGQASKPCDECLYPRGLIRLCHRRDGNSSGDKWTSIPHRTRQRCGCDGFTSKQHHRQVILRPGSAWILVEKLEIVGLDFLVFEPAQP